MLHKIYSSKEIAEIIDARIISESATDLEIKDILVDSRRLISPDQCMFFALNTSRNSGHKYINGLYKKMALEMRKKIRKYIYEAIFTVKYESKIII